MSVSSKLIREKFCGKMIVKLTFQLLAHLFGKGLMLATSSFLSFLQDKFVPINLFDGKFL